MYSIRQVNESSFWKSFRKTTHVIWKKMMFCKPRHFCFPPYLCLKSNLIIKNTTFLDSNECSRFVFLQSPYTWWQAICTLLTNGTEIFQNQSILNSIYPQGKLSTYLNKEVLFDAYIICWTIKVTGPICGKQKPFDQRKSANQLRKDLRIVVSWHDLANSSIADKNVAGFSSDDKTYVNNYYCQFTEGCTTFAHVPFRHITSFKRCFNVDRTFWR